uniref:Uncharacterized protein n=1 Tax=Anopheles quadriannulatus TaxID=34691 RepID=A0A182XTJ6_ANOQN
MLAGITSKVPTVWHNWKSACQVRLVYRANREVLTQRCHQAYDANPYRTNNNYSHHHIQNGYLYMKMR